MANMKEDLLRALRYCYQEGLIWGPTGCISVRLGGQKFLITPRGASYIDPEENQIGLYEWSKKKWRGPGLPPIEVRIHREIYNDRGQIKAIVQCQPLFATIAACQERRIDSYISSLSATLIEKIIEIPYHHQGSDELHNAIRDRVINSDILLIKNYGLVVAGKSLKDAIDKTLTFEYICKVQFYAQAANSKLLPLSEDTVDSLKDFQRKNMSVFLV